MFLALVMHSSQRRIHLKGSFIHLAVNENESTHLAMFTSQFAAVIYSSVSVLSWSSDSRIRCCNCTSWSLHTCSICSHTTSCAPGKVAKAWTHPQCHWRRCACPKVPASHLIFAPKLMDRTGPHRVLHPLYLFWSRRLHETT